MSTVTVLATQTYAAGTYTIPSTAIPDTITDIGIAILRCTSADPTIWPNATDTISYDLKVAINGGPAQDWASGSDTGGIHIQPKNGVEIPTMNIDGSLPAGTNRTFSGTITLSASIKTGASVTVT